MIRKNCGAEDSIMADVEGTVFVDNCGDVSSLESGLYIVGYFCGECNSKAKTFEDIKEA